MSTLVQPAMVIPEQVYPGLRPFRRDESILFFGRQEHVDELLGRLEETSFVAVVGLSGSGKSSLVLAGLLSAIERGHLGGVGSLWQVADLRPGSDPLGALAAALDKELGASPGRAGRLRSGRLGLVEAAEAGRKPGANLLLVVDQFEELLRFQRTFEDKSHEAAEFVRLLLAASSEYPARLYVVITMRSDYLGECARFPGLAEALNGSQYLTPRLTREQLREAMTGPPALRKVRVEPMWLESVLDQTAENRDQLPVLQHMLRQMWNRHGRGSELGEADFKAVGGLNALNEHADAVYDKVGNQELARRIFQCLTESAEPGRENRRPRTMQELVDETSSDFSAVENVVNHFREEGCNFLSPPKDKKVKPYSVIDITHESLIRGWTQLKGWARKDADSGEWYRRVEDRLRTSKGETHLASPELEAAVEARKEGGWNPAWAKRYAGKDPRDYGEVVRWLEVSQRETSRRARTRLWILAGVAIGLAALAVAAVWAAFTIKQQKGLAEKNLRIGTIHYLVAGSLNSLDLDPELSVSLAAQATGMALSERASLVGEAEDALHRAVLSSHIRLVLLGHQGKVNSVTFSPDGKLVATAGDDRKVMVWNALTGEKLTILSGHKYPVRGVAFSPDGKLLATASEDRTANVWESSTGRLLTTLRGHKSRLFCVAWSPNGKQVATGSEDTTAILWDVTSGRIIHTFQGHTREILGVAFSPDGALLATASNDWTARLWDVDTGKSKRTIAGHQLGVTGVAFSPDGKTLATSSWDWTARIWGSSGSNPRTIIPGQNAFTALTFNPDGRTLATASADKTAVLWDVTSGRELLKLAGHNDSVAAVSFDKKGKQLATASWDGSARLWDVSGKAELLTLSGENETGNLIAVDPSGRCLATVSFDRPVRIWNTLSGEEIRTLPVYARNITGIAFSRDGKRLATASQDEPTRVWNRVYEAELTSPVATPLPNQGSAGATGVAFGVLQKRLAVPIAGNQVEVWDVDSGRRVLLNDPKRDSSARITSIAFVSEHGKELIATGGTDSVARLWDAISGNLLQALHFPNWVTAVSFSPDGQLLAIAVGDGTAREYDVVSGKEVRTLAGHTNWVTGVAFSPDGKWLATSSGDRTAKIWDVESGNNVMTLYGHTAWLTGVAFSPDGERIITASHDGTVQVYAFDPKELISIAQNRVTRPLTAKECLKYLQLDRCPPGLRRGVFPP